MLEASVERWLATRRPEGAPPSRLSPGTRVEGWRVQAYLGAGLSAEVYRVTHVRTGQEGALKLLVDETRGLKDRFAAEADALRVLSLRVLPRFLDAGKHEGRPFYVMEYLQPLPDPLPRGEVPGFMVRVAQAVQVLHDAGYIHRDLKPGNILRRANGEPVLIDLGLIKRRGLGVTDPSVRHGRGGVSLIDGKPVGVGTLDYAAPEQLLKGEASMQSDVFALGKILRSLYEGRPPHSVQPVIRRATRELPSDRFASAADFAAALRHRNRAWVVGAILFFGLLCLLGAGLIPLLRRSPEPAVGVAPQTSPHRARATEPRPTESEAAYLARMLPRARAGEAAAQVAVEEA